MHDGLYDRLDVKGVCFSELGEIRFNGVVPDVDDGLPAALADAVMLEGGNVQLEDLCQVEAEAPAFVEACKALGAKVQEIMDVVEVDADALDDVNDGLGVNLLDVLVGACHEACKHVFVEVHMKCFYWHGHNLNTYEVEEKLEVFAHGRCEFLFCRPMFVCLHELWGVGMDAIDKLAQPYACIGRHINVFSGQFRLHLQDRLHVREKDGLRFHAL